MINGYIDNQTTSGQGMDATPEPTEAQTTIDTDRYEGHTIGDMTFSQAGEKLWFLEHPHSPNASDCMTMNKATLDLITDAPLLLAEVKQLQAEVKRLRQLSSRLRAMFNRVKRRARGRANE